MVSHVSTAYLAAMGVGNQVFDLLLLFLTLLVWGAVLLLLNI